MFDGARGPAHRKAMELLVRYGEALGAERFAEVRDVATVTTVANPIVRNVALQHGMDGVFSRFNLDSDEIVATPTFEAATCQPIHGIYRAEARKFGVADEAVRLHDESKRFFGRHSVQMLSTCTPYRVGNVPTLGEHCAWMESSAVIYCNSVLGGRTNTEGRESTSAAAVTGRIPSGASTCRKIASGACCSGPRSKSSRCGTGACSAIISARSLRIACL